MNTPKLGYVYTESTNRQMRELQQRYNQLVTWYNELAEERDQAREAAAHFFHCVICGEGSLCDYGERYARQLGLLVDDE